MFKLKKESRLIFYEKIFEIRNTNVPLQNIEYFQNVKMFQKKIVPEENKIVSNDTSSKHIEVKILS